MTCLCVGYGNIGFGGAEVSAEAVVRILLSVLCVCVRMVGFGDG